jgi:hypothetical protein
MEYVRQTIGSSALNGIVEIPPTLRNRNVQIIILPAENEVVEEPEYKQGFKVNMGFLKGKVPELPDSFFDPLPEEELQAWGL